MPTQNIPLRFAPGVFGNGTAYQGRGRWITADISFIKISPTQYIPVFTGFNI